EIERLEGALVAEQEWRRTGLLAIATDTIIRHDHDAAALVAGVDRGAIGHVIPGDLAVAQLQAAVVYLDVPAVVVDPRVMQHQITAFAGQQRAAGAPALNLGILERDIAARPAKQALPALPIVCGDKANRPIGRAKRI